MTSCGLNFAQLLYHFLNNYCKTVFFDIQNNEGWGRGYQRKPKAKADNPHGDLDNSGYHKN